MEPLKLAEGTEVTEDPNGAKADDQNAEGPLAGILALVREIEETIPPEEWDVLPRDPAKNKNHYLYRHPKVED